MLAAILTVAFVCQAQAFILDSITSSVSKSICYGSLGCFDSGPPFLSAQRPLSVVPQSPDIVQTHFYLYTRDNPSVATEEVISADNPSSVSSSHFSCDRNTKVIVHGFTHNGHVQWIHNMKSELLKKGDFNVIVVDWGHGSGPPYTQATANTRLVGAQLGQLIKVLITNSECTAAMFHIIGHSLGAHIAGYVSGTVKNVGRITGLDPADPYFTGTDVVVRLDPSDAAFVDVIHTDGSDITELGFGSSQSMGHVDFFPNGGEDQPGCDAGLLGKVGHSAWIGLTHLDLYAAEGSVACSHERAYEYFTESINSQCPFKAYPCTSAEEFKKGNCLKCHGQDCSQMGYNADQYSARGSLYLETGALPKYCSYHYQFNITGTNNFDGMLTVIVHGTKGDIGPVQLMTQNEIHNQGEIIHKFIRSDEDIGNITSVTLGYEKTSSLLLSWAYPNDWHLAGISLFNGEQQSRTSFCAYGKEVDNHSRATFMARNGHC